MTPPPRSATLAGAFPRPTPAASKAHRHPSLADRHRADRRGDDRPRTGQECSRKSAIAGSPAPCAPRRRRPRRLAREYIVHALKAGILGAYAGGRLLARPLIAQTLVEIADIEQATTVAHGDPAGPPRRSTARSAPRPDHDRAGPGGRVGHDAGGGSSTTHGERHVTLPVAFNGLGYCASAPRSVILKSGEPAAVDIAFERGAPVSGIDAASPCRCWICWAASGIIAGAHGVASLAALHTFARRA